MVVVAVCALGYWLLLNRNRDSARRALRVRRAIEEKRLETAQSELAHWLQTEPRSAQAHFLKARLAWSMDDLATVDRELGSARSLGYSGRDLDRARGLLLARGDRKREAEALLKRAIADGQEADPEASLALATLYMSAFRLEEAGWILDDWARKAPADVRPLLLRAEVDIRLSAAPEIILGRYQRALERDSKSAPARLGLAEQLRVHQRFEEAAAHYREYLESRPDDLAGLLGAGQDALELGRLDEATRLLDRALARAPRDPVALGARATVEERLGRFESALAYLDRALAADPFDVANHYHMMVILTRLGRRGLAEKERRAVERLKDEQAWFARVSRDLRYNPTDVELRAQAAQWLLTHGHEQEGVEWANMVLRERPSHPLLNRLLADYYRRTGQLGLANLHETHAAPAAEKPGESR